MRIEDFKHIYFLGIGGIGMSALARYFHVNKFVVSGYDKTESELTQTLSQEGIAIHYHDKGEALLEELNKAETLVIFTPAVNKHLGELIALEQAGFTIIKRSKALGLLTQSSKGLGVAGTHGKTTTSTLLAHVLQQSHLGCNAFLGGISSNYNSNLILHPTSEYTVVEADEFDRSFLQLKPFASIITSTDADHLDIYGDAETLKENFQAYCDLTSPAGLLIQQVDTEVSGPGKTLTYAVNQKAKVYSDKLRYVKGKFLFDYHFQNKTWENIELGIPGIHNAENATAIIALCQFLGLSETEIRNGLSSFKGVKRRFEYHIKTDNRIYIDDYAHHPTEVKALLKSIELLYPEKKIIGIFQPHLFSRTQDFMEEFAQELSRLDELILLPIYPAREEPIPGITSEVLLQKTTNTTKRLLAKEDLLDALAIEDNAVYLTIGAGDIDRLIQPLKAKLS
ncbi:UDP-N-acetylmuramate--L-alanine ligase [Lishizhenia tianjinensis]|uniref:UDP-N-acetylmuramate--L-alanine ligase n=1 Tax=Lishizhenia tianjinensis TaxID=477690 RepID=A0A1I6ZZ48_9FLAO|nr:UDP-N-acetylmuramate--L-alanine ligase [Lishizhenia tianjinensis]SFT67917.1 UDP-N-acetylmuramate--L-alanine ligase [Lishizhenia tianjinensis]